MNYNQVYPQQTTTLNDRMAQAALITPECRREIYNILCQNPYNQPLFANDSLKTSSNTMAIPQTSKITDAATKPNSDLFGSSVSSSQFKNFCHNAVASDRGKQQLDIRTKKTALFWQFKMPGVVQNSISFNGCEFIRSTDSIDNATLELTYQAIGAIGVANEAGAAVTEAFEKLIIKEYIPKWTENDINKLSISFIIAFSHILPVYLNITHIIRSRTLSQKDVQWLRGLSSPQIQEIHTLLDLFQDF